MDHFQNVEVDRPHLIVEINNNQVTESLEDAFSPDEIDDLDDIPDMENFENENLLIIQDPVN